MRPHTLFLILKGHDRINDVQTMVQVFYPNRGYKQTNKVPETGMAVLSHLLEDRCICRVYEQGQLHAEHQTVFSEFSEMDAVKLSIFYALSRLSGTKPSWGILTGIRPAKIVSEAFGQGKSEASALQLLTHRYLVSAQKAQLAIDVAKNEAPYAAHLPPHSFSLYIGIPFCPSRCLYCSFTAYPIEKYQNRQQDYLDALKKELDAYPLGGSLANIYIGGGTPTSLSDDYFEQLLQIVKQRVGEPFLKSQKEYTVEAGRPDTISQKKLEMMRFYGVNRLSINPQTMQDKTLQKIGRNHSVGAVVEAFNKARAAGFDNINMDIIVGLPGETVADVSQTMAAIKQLDPDSLTCHTLSVKRASRLNETLFEYNLTDSAQIEQMLLLVDTETKAMGMHPYYMYRQKNMLGNFENVGYAKSAKGCAYNVHIMQERHTVMAYGAGAVTKVVAPDGHIFRIFDVKDAQAYITRIDEMITRKKTLALESDCFY